jgi:hypothetical protein
MKRDAIGHDMMKRDAMVRDATGRQPRLASRDDLISDIEPRISTSRTIASRRTVSL